MPYYISDKQADCKGWAVIKVEDNKPVTVACHDTKQGAVDQMVAVSMAEGLRPMGQFFAGTAGEGRDGGDGNNQVLICDIDDTLMHNGMLIADTADFVAKQNVGIELVTGRLEADRAQTVAQLAKLGMDYDKLWMNNLGSSAKSVEFKKKTAEELLKNYDVTLAIDNDGGARAAYASLGIPVIDPTRLPVKREMNPADQYPAEDDTTTLNGVAVLPCTKEDLALRLKDLLGDTVNFKFLAHGFHWNVRGVNFAQYHKFFEEIDTDANDAIDPIAENIRKLNFDAPIKLNQYLESVDEIEPTDSSDPLEMCRSLYMANEDVLESVVHALQIANELDEQGIVNFLAERQDAHSKNQWQLRAIVGDSFAKNYQIDVHAVAEGQTGEGNEKPAEIDTTPANATPNVNVNADGTPMVQMNSTATKWAKAAEMIVRKLEPVQEVPLSEERGSKIETRVNHVDMELRATSADGMTFEGYASVFNSPSEPIGGKFTEYVAPGAFKRSLAARNDVKLLWNHDTGQVLGSTRAGTLQLVEDSHGLKAIATLPDTQLGRDAATLIKRGDVANMSFGFSVPAGGDAWSGDGQTRTLNSVRLHEVSIVAFPAYQASTANVRAEIRSLDADLLTDGLTKLENGEDLTPAEAEALTGVVAKLTKTEKVEQSLDLLKAKLSLQAKAI
jgi:uncharacterized protein